MPLQFGAGPTLIEARPWLRDEKARHERILDVAERNSVIEGSPPFTDDFRDRLRAELQMLAAMRLRPSPSSPPAAPRS